MTGYVYLLINYSMPGLVKVGYTERPPEERMSELSRATGVPTPFTLVYDILVPDAPRAERVLHDDLAARGFRVADNREFFSAPIHEVVKLMIQVREAMEASVVSGRELSGVASHSSVTADQIIEEIMGDWDELFRDAALACIRRGRGSTKLLQTELKIGYGRAARIIDQLHDAGVLGPPDGPRDREVLVSETELGEIMG